MKKSIYLFLVACVLFSFATFSCNEKESVPDPTENLNFFFSVDDALKQVAFTAMINYGDVFQWDFGDGNTSNERNPVYAYAEGGSYFVTLKVTGRGATKEITKRVSLALSNFQMLAGDNTYPEGKKWRISSNHSETDRLAWADEQFTVYEGTYLPASALGMVLGLGDVYDDEYVFTRNGSYQRMPRHGGTFAGLVYVMMNGIKVLTPSSDTSYPFCYAEYNPKAATFTFTENEDYTIMSAAYGRVGNVTYQNVKTLSFSENEFIGFLDYNRKCVVLSLTPTTMQLAFFACLDLSAAAAGGIATHAIILTFEEVR